MKKKFIIFTLCFTLLFSSINYKRSYAFDVGVISLPILATVSSLAVASGIVLSSDDDLYDIGRLFFDYIDRHNDLTWFTVQSVFASSVSLQANKLVSVKSEFLDIVKGFFDSEFNYNSNVVGSCGNLPYYGSLDYLNPSSYVGHYVNMSEYLTPGSSFTVGDFTFTYKSKDSSDYTFTVSSPFSLSSSNVYFSTNFKFDKMYFYVADFKHSVYPYALCITTDYYSYGRLDGRALTYFNSIPVSIPNFGDYTWDNVESKKENESVALPVPGDLGQLVGQGSKDFWDNADDLVGGGDISLPGVDNPSIGLDGVTSFPSVDSDSGVDNPSVPSEGIWSTIKDFIISLVVPNDSFWTDTWGGLYNNFTDSFPMVDMSGFNDLVTGEKKFPNIDIDIMGVSGRVVNGDVINSIVDWLRPIIAGFMMICLMLFNYRKIYKLIRNSEPFEGIGKVEHHAN